MHADALTVEQTDWPQIVALYDQLLAAAYQRAAAMAPTDAEQDFLRRGRASREADR